MKTYRSITIALILAAFLLVGAVLPAPAAVLLVAERRIVQAVGGRELLAVGDLDAAAEPLALSFAPGESDVKSRGSLTRESISPDIITMRSGSSVPR